MRDDYFFFRFLFAILRAHGGMLSSPEVGLTFPRRFGGCDDFGLAGFLLEREELNFSGSGLRFGV